MKIAIALVVSLAVINILQVVTNSPNLVWLSFGAVLAAAITYVFSIKE